MLDAAAVRDLRRLLELLAAGTVEPLVIADVQVVRVAALDPAEELGDRLAVARLRRPYPVVVAYGEPLPVLREPDGHQVHPLLRRPAVLLGRLHHRLRVLVHPHEEMDPVTPKPPVSGDAVGAHLLQRVPQVRVAVGVVDRGGDVELGHAER
jgi:hypothetical protein